MGLAASQARLLTITSRLSSVELRQQRIAMDKMRLANDTDAVSTKYTTALNNKTLSFSNGSNSSIPLTYSLLEEQGYTVARASDGLAPTSLGKVNFGLKAYSGGTDFNEDLSNLSLKDLANPKNGEDYVVILAGENGRKSGVPYDEAKSNFVSIANQIISVIQKSLGIDSTSASSFVVEMNKYVEEMKNKINFQDHNKSRSSREACEGGVTEAKNGLVGNFTITSSLFGYDNDAFTLNLSEMVKRLVQKATSLYTSTSAPTSEVLNKKTESTQIWNNYETLQEKNKTTNSNSSQLTEGEQLYEQLNNSQFLIQGLLSGYLTLMKDGQQVSLGTNTQILESYDKSDDAAAEAEYNAEIAKINRKEKMLDMESKRIETEYSALTTEYESIKSIISTHASKDFQYFS